MKIPFTAKKGADGTWQGTFQIPLPVGPATVSTTGRNRQEAVARAAVLAKSIVQNPLIASVLPPGAPLAVAALSKLAQSPTAATLAKFAGPGAKRLGKALKSIF